MTTELTKGQITFCQHIVLGESQCASYQAAFPDCKPESARKLSTKLMKMDKIQRYISDLQSKALEQAAIEVAVQEVNTIISAENVLSILSSIASGSPQGAINDYGESILVSPKVGERIKAAELLAKHYGLLKENIVQDHEIHISVAPEIMEIGK